MKKDVLIKIVGTQIVDDDSSSIEILTVGTFYRRNESYYISYDESEATGLAGSHTTLKIDPTNRVTLLRSGRAATNLVIESGRRHQCNYGTEYGDMQIGISGHDITSELSDEGGSLSFRYSVDVDTALTSENHVHININIQEGVN